ncbi:MAG: folate-binding protein YgfZ [Proteobacteria bacterium]|nr:MAG: folate-binding protein YgfZ [Pseudomonadota bacterium]
MKPGWKQFLLDKGAEFENSQLIHFGNPERERRIPPQGALLCDLSHIGLIAASGEDARDFLQGQLSNDINLVSEQRAQISSYNSPKGRAYTDLQIMLRQGVYYLTLSSDILEAVLKRLRIFVMRSKVSLEDAQDSLVHFGYADPKGEQRLREALGTMPEQVLDVVQQDNLTIIRRPASVPRFEIWGELEAACNLWNQLNVHAAAVSLNAWDYFEISAGIPHISLASMEAWVPQMLNLQLLGGISFNKGCFPGQEVIARLKYLGKNKRQTYRIGTDSVKLPEVGTAIINAEGKEAGNILNATLNPDGVLEALAVLKIKAAQQETLILQGNAVTILDLPYTLENMETA